MANGNRRQIILPGEIVWINIGEGIRRPAISRRATNDQLCNR